MEDLSAKADHDAEERLERAVAASMGGTLSCAEQEIVRTVTSASKLGSRIYRDGTQLDNEPVLGQLRQTVARMPPSTAGGNSLVWVYFIAAAHCSTDDDRQFFTNRLVEIYNITGWANIVTGLLTLRQAGQAPDGSWNTSIRPDISTAFVM